MIFYLKKKVGLESGVLHPTSIPSSPLHSQNEVPSVSPVTILSLPHLSQTTTDTHQSQTVTDTIQTESTTALGGTRVYGGPKEP